MPTAFKTLLRRLQTSARPRGRRQFKAVQVDALESRILPTAVVTFNGADMKITGDSGTNNITLTRVGNVVNVDANGGFITVAGSDVPSFNFNLAGAFNLTATFQDNVDALTVVGGLQLKNVSVKLGDGLTNVFTMADASVSGKLTVTADDGVDVVVLQNTTVTGATSINTGWNTDVLQLVDCTFTGAATINTDNGADQVFIIGSAARTKFGNKLTLNTGDDEDVVTMAKVDTKAVSVDLGQGLINQFIAQDVLLTGGLTVKGGGGTDVAALVSVVQSGTGANSIDLGAGTDIATMAQATLTGATTINVGSGTGNQVVIDDVLFNSTFTYNSQGFGDVVAIEQNTAALGATTFVKAAKFTFGTLNNMVLSNNDPATVTKFLSTVSFTGRPQATTITVRTTTSFAIAPVLKNVVIV
jgi:hypothetical protein